MKAFITLAALAATLIVFAGSCKKEDAAQATATGQVAQGSISGINGPVSGTIDRDIVISLLWYPSNATSRVDHLLDSAGHNTRIIRLFTITSPLDTVAAVRPQATFPYFFKVSTPGAYYLKFYKTGNDDKTAIIDTILIK